jgi:hypothetical protein
VKCNIGCSFKRVAVAAATAAAAAAAAASASASASAFASTSAAAAAFALPLSIEHWSSPRGIIGDILGQALRHHPHGVLERLPLVAEPDPNYLAVVAQLLRKRCNLVTCNSDQCRLMSPNLRIILNSFP